MSKKRIAYARRTLLDPEEEDEQLPFEPRNIVVHSDYWVTRDYSLLDVIGRGKFGEVRKCKETGTNRMLAAKTIVCRNKDQLDGALHEIEMMSALRHPKILMIYDAFQNGKAVCIVTELIEGGELFDKIVESNFNLTERVAILFMRQIVDGVAYIHSQNIIHLDLKPENIICVSKTSTRVKIIDFGLALKYNKSQPQRALAGTVDFMSPEVVNYEIVTPASDMWSVGVICYVLVSGLSPFVGETDAETLCNITRCVFDYDAEEFLEITDSCKDFINKLIIKDSRKRLTAVEAFNHGWLQKITRAQTMKHLSKKHHFKFFAKRKWHKAFAAIIAINRLERLGRSHTAVLAEIASRMALEQQQQQQRAAAAAATPTSRKCPALPPLRSAGVQSPGFTSPRSGDGGQVRQKFEFDKPSASAPSHTDIKPTAIEQPAAAARTAAASRPVDAATAAAAAAAGPNLSRSVGARAYDAAANVSDAPTVPATTTQTRSTLATRTAATAAPADRSHVSAAPNGAGTGDQVVRSTARRQAGDAATPAAAAATPAAAAATPAAAAAIEQRWGAGRSENAVGGLSSGNARAGRGSGVTTTAARAELGSLREEGAVAADSSSVSSLSRSDRSANNGSAVSATTGGHESRSAERGQHASPRAQLEQEREQQQRGRQQVEAAAGSSTDAPRRTSGERRRFESLGGSGAAESRSLSGDGGTAASLSNGDSSPHHESAAERRWSRERTSGQRSLRGSGAEADDSPTTPARTRDRETTDESSCSGGGRRSDRSVNDDHRSSPSSTSSSPSSSLSLRTASGQPLSAEERRRRIAAILNDDDGGSGDDFQSRLKASPSARTAAFESTRMSPRGAAALPKHEVQRLERLRKILETTS